MHIGLIDGPLVPHNLISSQESPVPLPKFQMARRLKISALCVQESNPDILFLFSLKSLQTSSRFPNMAPVERDTRLQDIFTYLLKPAPKFL